MTRVLRPGTFTGRVAAPASKSWAHRFLLCAALSEGPSILCCPGMGADVLATARCLSAMGAGIRRQGDELSVSPLGAPTAEPLCLACGESGTTLRFLLPLAGVLGLRGAFLPEGRLPRRPMGELTEALARHGMTIAWDGTRLCFSGQLQPGEYVLPGDVSSQYISGLLLALPLLDAPSRLTVTGPVESRGYLTMTETALTMAGASVRRGGGAYTVSPVGRYRLPERVALPGDWSAGAFWLCAGALLPEGLTVSGLEERSAQGDRAILELLRRFGAQISRGPEGITVRRGALRGMELDAGDIPDLVPPLAVCAAGAAGVTRIFHAGRLRFKESDRLRAICDLLRGLGCPAEETADGLVIPGQPWLAGGTVSARGDHRIAMSAATAAILCRAPVTLTGAETVEKSYPRFWEDYARLRGEEAT